MTALPWIAIALVLVAFSLADELPDPRVWRVMLVAAWAVLAVGLALTAAGSTGAVPPSGIAAGPLAFLIVHRALRRVFLSWKGGEPVLATRGGRSGDGRIWYEPKAVRTVGWRDYLYSLLVGVAMLLATFPAMAEIVARNG